MDSGTTGRRENVLHDLAPALGVAVLSAILGAAALHAPPETGEMGVVFAPWTGQGEAIATIAAAGGRVVDTGRLPNVVIAYAADAGFDDRVRQMGAWFITAASGLCAPAA
ncbi:hypothetical protein VE25_14665 [Devosia geojensis]|uniref:Uncharacterized protein n=1 Tax=Devosia geojensis TaxID=443610 RepID=A0A0F5FQA8_9HYPH|nr:hypothetical protein [Devosia geojensis]KKB11026.1 hypothetical protein VE25_14665 [Devosia geojensis]